MSAPQAGEGPAADLYRCLWLEPLIEVAQGLARDVMGRPARYRDAPGSALAAALLLQRAVGTDPALPGPTQRAAVYRACLDPGLLAAGAALRRAASHEFLARRRPGSVPAAETAAASAALRARLARLDGAATALVTPIRNVLRLALDLLQLDGVSECAGMPGIAIEPPERWLRPARLDGALLGAITAVAGAGARTLAAAAAAAAASGSAGETVAREAHGWNRALAGLAQQRASGPQPRLGVVGTGGWPGRRCLFWLCDDYWVCGFLPGRIWPTCFKARICYCAIYQA